MERVPSLGSSSPASTLRNVDLPEPVTHTRPYGVAGLDWIETPANEVSRPKDLPRSETAIIEPVMIAGAGGIRLRLAAFMVSFERDGVPNRGVPHGYPA